MKSRLLFLSVLVFSSTALFAQQDKLITHFMYDKMSVNPGETGLDGGQRSICAASIYRNQWDKVNGAPNSVLLNVEANLGHISPYLTGLGLAFYHDAIGFTRQNNLLLNYSYHLPISVYGELGVGIGLGLINVGMNPEWVPPTSAVDPTLPQGFKATSFDLNFGVYWKGAQDYYAGISTTHLTQSTLTDMTTGGLAVNYNSARHYYIMGGKKFKGIGPGDIDANIMMRTEFVKFSADINVRYFLDMIPAYAGVTYRTSDAVAIMLGYKPVENLTVGYSYDVTTNRLSGISAGSHEIMLKYCHYLPLPPLTTSKHPRWL